MKYRTRKDAELLSEIKYWEQSERTLSVWFHWKKSARYWRLLKTNPPERHRKN